MRLKHIRRAVTDPAVGAVLHVAMAVVGWVSYRRLQGAATALGTAVFMFYPRGRRLVRANLRTAFPEWSRERRADLARQVFRNTLLGFFEFLWFARHPERLQDEIDVDGDAVRRLRHDLAAEGPAICLTPHLGNWELMGQVVACLGIPLSVVAHPIRNRWVDGPVTRARKHHGLEVIQDRGAARQIVRAVRSGRNVGILMDQNTRPHEGGVFCDFFGIPVACTRAPGSLAFRLRRPVFVAACVRVGGRLTVVCRRLPKPATEYTDDVAVTAAMLAANEALVRDYAEQYAWTYERWRYIPPDLPAGRRRRYPDYAKEYRPAASG